MKTAALEPNSIKEPIPAIFHAWELLANAAEAHLNGNYADADVLFREANLPEVWNWLHPEWCEPWRNIRVPKPDGDTQPVPKIERHALRHLTEAPDVKAAVLARDGYRCRYCGIPVVDARIREIAHELYAEAVPWPKGNKEEVLRRKHYAFQCLWLQYDHVVPHSHGGLTSENNIVISCALCNFGKDKYTLRQLGISDPRLRPPVPVPWDGLERLRACGPEQRRPKASAPTSEIQPKPLKRVKPKFLQSYYLTGQKLDPTTLHPLIRKHADTLYFWDGWDFLATHSDEEIIQLLKSRAYNLTFGGALWVVADHFQLQLKHKSRKTPPVR